MKSDLIDLELCRHHETERAVLVSLDGDRTKAVWLPLAVIEIEPKGRNVIVTMPERLALEKELI